MNPDSITRQFREGMEAERAGKEPYDNPYPLSELSTESFYNWKRREWARGWQQVNDDRKKWSPVLRSMASIITEAGKKEEVKK